MLTLMKRERRARRRTAAIAALAIWSASAALPTHAFQSSDGDAIATVNGRSIKRRDVVKLAMDARGLAAMQQLIVLKLSRQETKRLGITVTTADIEAENLSAARKIMDAAQGADTLKAADGQRLLEALLDKRGLSMAEFRIGMERNAHLRKVAELNVHIDAARVREEFARTYGAKVRIRHIELTSLKAAAKAQDYLRDGVTFEETARRLSVNRETAAGGGALPPFTYPDENIPAAMREAAFALVRGQVSLPIGAKGRFHLLKLEERIPPAGVKFGDVVDKVTTSLRERLVTEAMSKLATDLFQKARIRVIDPKLRKQYEKLLAENRGK